ncbi:MAG TPA: PP2C family protein-serine/threonine phosphatase [Acidisarcina sp.]
MNTWKEQAGRWREMPLASSIRFFSGVFCLFAALSLISSCMHFQSQTPLDLVCTILVGGGFAIGWAFAGTRRLLWLFPVVGGTQFLTYAMLGSSSGRHWLDSAGMARKLNLDGWLAIAFIVSGYILFLLFFRNEGARFFKTQTEVRLAGEIHRALVPVRHVTIANVEIFGTSIPSSEVGGDLFDIVQCESGWHAYVADVSGHGLAAGILMSMIKSATSMQLNKLKRPDELLTDLNDVMQPFTSPANYLTFAYVGGSGSSQLNFALAGHLPILHYCAQSKTIIEHADDNVPIGLFKDQTFAISQLSLERGDLLAIVTDGFTEVFDSKERELGIEELKHMLLARAGLPLADIYGQLRSITMSYGEQTDDQTMLLVRAVA